MPILLVPVWAIFIAASSYELTGTDSLSPESIASPLPEDEKPLLSRLLESLFELLDDPLPIKADALATVAENKEKRSTIATMVVAPTSFLGESFLLILLHTGPNRPTIGIAEHYTICLEINAHVFQQVDLICGIVVVICDAD